MKKIIAMLIVIALCLGLCACGGSEESIVLPTKPAQSAPQNQPVVQETQSAASDEAQETPESTGETYPWEAEFREEDYFKFEGEPAPNGDKAVTWLEGELLEKRVRELYEWADGTIKDSYYYPSGNTSHIYMRYTDGTYVEEHYLDDGYIDLENNEIHMGTLIYQKQIGPNGMEDETFYDENGNVTSSTHKGTDGFYSETYYENGRPIRDISDNPATGEHSEGEYFEDGSPKKYVSDNPEAGTYSELEYYENGNLKYSKSQSPEYTTEERYDEEGYHTYFYSKDANWETELTADETGKLVKVTENGTVYEDAATLAQYAANYNFRG